MSFDYSPDSITAEAAAAGLAPLTPRAACPPQPSLPEVAALVRELFAEGTLSWDQLSELARGPELQALLAETVAAVPAIRKPRTP